MTMSQTVEGKIFKGWEPRMSFQHEKELKIMEKEQDVKFKKQCYNDKLAELQREKEEFKREKEVF